MKIRAYETSTGYLKFIVEHRGQERICEFAPSALTHLGPAHTEVLKTFGILVAKELSEHLEALAPEK